MKTKLPPDIAAQITRPNKHHAKRTLYNGQWYDSKAEADRAMELDLLVKAGQVAWWLRQVPIMVGEPGVDKPYRVDFLVATHWSLTGLNDLRVFRIHAEDVKGMETQSFRRHVRQWRLRGPFELHIISKHGTEIVPKGSEV